MNKKILFGFLLPVFSCSFNLNAQQVRIDSIATYILHQTATNLQSLESCCFTAETNYDVWNNDLGYVRHSYEDIVDIKFPDKLRLKSSGDKGNRSLWHNGKELYYYSKDNNHYGSLPTPKNVVQMMDTIHKKFGIEFPAADFFYHTFVNDLISTGSNIVYLGISKANGKDCFHIAGKNATSSFQFWIDSEDNFFFPVKMLITYFEKDAQSQRYEATFSNWNLNSNLPDIMFEFAVPPSASKIKIQATK